MRIFDIPPFDDPRCARAILLGGDDAVANPLSAWNKVMGLNVSSVFQLTKQAAKQAFLPQGRGVVLNIASIEGLLAIIPSGSARSPTTHSKGAIISMTRALAAEGGPRNIRVNALAPGFFPSQMMAGTLDSHGEELIAQTPRGKLGGEADLMGPARPFSPRTRVRITGPTIVVDGKMTKI